MTHRQLFLQPCGNEIAARHFEETIEKPVSLRRLEGTLHAPTLGKLFELSPEGELGFWGIMSGHEGKQRRIFQNMQPGDVVLFIMGQRVIAIGEVALTFVDRPVATKLWGRDDSGETWENIFVLSRIESIDLDGIEFKQIVGYKENLIFRGFSKVKPEKAVRFFGTALAKHFLRDSVRDSEG